MAHPCGVGLGKGGSWVLFLFASRSPPAIFDFPIFLFFPIRRGPGRVPRVPVYGTRVLGWAGGQFDFVEDKRESRRLVVQDNTEEGRVDVETVIAVFNEAEFPEFVHEKIHPRPRGPNHFSEHLL